LGGYFNSDRYLVILEWVCSESDKISTGPDLVFYGRKSEKMTPEYHSGLRVASEVHYEHLVAFLTILS
jgi:hypothetical protein